MSPLLPSRPRTLIALAPDAVTALRVVPGWRSRVTDSLVLPVAGTPTANVPWRPAVQALQSLLGKAEWRQEPHQIVLSNHFVHYLVIAPNARLRTQAERQAYAAIAFQKIYGHLAADWELRVSPGAAQEPALASGIHRTLLAELRQAYSAPSTLLAIRPAMMGAFNAVQRKLDGGLHALLQLEKTRMTLALIARRQWVAIVSRSLANLDGETLGGWLDEQCALNNLVPQPGQACVWLHAEDQSLGARLGAPWTVRPIQPPVPLTDPRGWLAASGWR